MAEDETRNDNGTVNPPMNQDVKLASSPKTEDEKEFGPGRWVFSKTFQRPMVTGTKAGPLEDRIPLEATNVDEALAEIASRGLRNEDGSGVGPSGTVQDEPAAKAKTVDKKKSSAKKD